MSVRPLFAALLLACLPAGALHAKATLENSVVKVYSTISQPDPVRPWSKQPAREATGTGVVIEGKRILTNAHVVGYASQVQVQADQAGEKLPARVIAISRGVDLALLELEDPAFFDTHEPLKRANLLPGVKDAVMAYGYPTGGSSLSITKGIVSRIEFVRYRYPASGLRIQIDAAINPGNSGGPVIADDKMIGIAYATATNAQNIGYIIPNEEIEIFLKDIGDGRYDGKPALFDSLQAVENPALRAFLKLDKGVEGVMVTRPGSDDPAYPLKERDVITHIGATAIDNQGMAKLSPTLRVQFPYLVQHLAKDGKVPLTIIRDSKPMTVQVPVANDRPLLIGDLANGYPSYFIYGPVVFSRATAEFVGGLQGNAQVVSVLGARGNPLITRRGDQPSASRQELVVIASPFFPHKLVTGYGNRFSAVVASVNNIPVRSLRHLVETLRDLKDPLVTFRFDELASDTLVLPRADVMAATEAILTDNGIRSQGSADMMAVWQRK
ncbi:MAG TPA: trypsin-like peptidase domain-containing protein [Burkholderiaceae bacterium]